ncbi:DUF2500 domain-containing protein [Cellulosilyticum sp. I15G10I2]|uniref:DUF2500 domain-containing protein n=1 Tax=Cellulosilyticum sp. I15G10I2 TaxID=1892843 RepID=UPI00085C25AA|nr:DUF2500 domain-containing protein [Cellulosilyticum sp. I15G10I2]
MSQVGFGAFDMMFNIVPVIILLGFIFVFGTIIYRIVNIAKDKRKPIIPVRAKVVAKRTQVRGGHTSHNDMHGHTLSSTYYYATFELENGERMELAIPSHQIGYIVEGDTGILNFQGSLFVKFDRI